MTCPSCRASIAAGASRCGACGALAAIPTEGALAPDLSRIREIPGARKPQRTWKDEVRDRVQTRRAARTTSPQDASPSAVEETEVLVEQRAPEGTLIEVGGDEPLSSAPYAVTEKFARSIDFDDDVVDLPLTPPPAEAPREAAPPRETPRVEAPRVEPVVREEKKPAPRVVEEVRPRPAVQPELKWDAPPAEASPETAEETRAAADAFAAAPLGERILAAALDVTLWSALCVLVLYFASRVAHQPMATLALSPWLLAFLAFLGIVYGAWFTGTTGQTVGKIATGLRVVDEEGRPPGAARALLRAATGLVGIAALGLGLVPVVLDPQRRALHDRLASTRVIRA